MCGQCPPAKRQHEAVKFMRHVLLLLNSSSVESTTGKMTVAFSNRRR